MVSFHASYINGKLLRFVGTRPLENNSFGVVGDIEESIGIDTHSLSMRLDEFLGATGK
jgi:hypothetical protein